MVSPSEFVSDVCNHPKRSISDSFFYFVSCGTFYHVLNSISSTNCYASLSFPLFPCFDGGTPKLPFLYHSVLSCRLVCGFLLCIGREANYLLGQDRHSGFGMARFSSIDQTFFFRETIAPLSSLHDGQSKFGWFLFFANATLCFPRSLCPVWVMDICLSYSVANLFCKRGRILWDRFGTKMLIASQSVLYSCTMQGNSDTLSFFIWDATLPWHSTTLILLRGEK